MTLATMLNKSGVAPRIAQEIMRHSDIRLTIATYTDAKLLNVSVALDSLPKLTPDRATDGRREAMRATGTNGKTDSRFASETGGWVHSVPSADILTADFGPKASKGTDVET